jgi:hypothetical protein
LLVGDEGDEGELGEVLRFWLELVPPAPDVLELPLVAPVPPPPAVSAGRSQPASNAPESARERARVSVRVSVPVIGGLLSDPEPSNKQTERVPRGAQLVTAQAWSARQ